MVTGSRGLKRGREAHNEQGKTMAGGNNKIAVILPSSNNADDDGSGNDNLLHTYPAEALRQSSAYFNGMLGGSWAENNSASSNKQKRGDDGESHAVVDLSNTGLHPQACLSVFQFMMARYEANVERCLGSGDDDVSSNSSDCNAADSEAKNVKVNDKQGVAGTVTADATDHAKFQISANCSNGTAAAAIITPEKERQQQPPLHHQPVTLHQIQSLLWDGYQWDEDPVDANHFEYDASKPTSSPLSNEEQLSQVIGSFCLEPTEEIQMKLWSMKMIQCPSLMEDALQAEGFLAERLLSGDRGCIRRLPDGGADAEAPPWRFFVLLFIGRMLDYDHKSCLTASKVETGISDLIWGLREDDFWSILRAEMMECGLLRVIRESEEASSDSSSDDDDDDDDEGRVYSATCSTRDQLKALEKIW